MVKKKGKAKRSRGKSPRMLLRSVIDDVEHGQCGSAVTSLVEAAKKTPSRGKMKKHLEEVTRAVVRGCLRGGGGFNVPAPARMAPRADPFAKSRHAPSSNAFAKLYKHAGPKGRIPGAPPPQHGGQSYPAPVRQSDEGWYGAPRGGHAVPHGPSVHTHPFEGLGRFGRHRRGR